MTSSGEQPRYVAVPRSSRCSALCSSRGKSWKTVSRLRNGYSNECKTWLFVNVILRDFLRASGVFFGIVGSESQGAENPAATLAIGAGLAWRLLSHPPIATAPISAGLPLEYSPC